MERLCWIMLWLHQGPDSQIKACQTGPDKNTAGSSWFPWPVVWRKLARLSPFVNKVKCWRSLVQSGQLPSSFLQTSGPGSQTEQQLFHSALWGTILSSCLGLVCHSIKKDKAQGTSNPCFPNVIQTYIYKFWPVLNLNFGPSASGTFLVFLRIFRKFLKDLQLTQKEHKNQTFQKYLYCIEGIL